MASVAGRPAPDGICAGRPVPQTELRIIPGVRRSPGLESERSGAVGGRARRGRRGAGEAAPTCSVATGTTPRPSAATRSARAIASWHRTGDGGWLDAEGRALADGPREAARRSRGRVWWSGPAELRACELPDVSRAAYFGALDPSRGQHAVLCVEMTDRRPRRTSSGCAGARSDPGRRATRGASHGARPALPAAFDYSRLAGSCSACVGWQRTHRRMQTLCILTRLFWLSRTK